MGRATCAEFLPIQCIMDKVDLSDCVTRDLDILQCMKCALPYLRSKNQQWPTSHGCGGAWKLVREPRARAALVWLLTRQTTY